MMSMVAIASLIGALILLIRGFVIKSLEYKIVGVILLAPFVLFIIWLWFHLGID